jgi:hypothetical protein
MVSMVASRWGDSGLAWLTGRPGGQPDFARAGILSRAQSVAQRLATAGVAVDVPTMLGGRAALLHLTRGGRVSAGRASRLLATTDGWCAVTLSRAEDIDAVPALLETDAETRDVNGDPWSAVMEWAARRPAAEVTDRARLLDIPAATLGETAPAPPLIRKIATGAAALNLSGAIVADLSSMWAGPLCGRLLAQAGAEVVKVESTRRPDGTRLGSRAFFDWVNSEKLSYAVDFHRDIGAIHDLLAAADVVIEGSRPAALARRGLGPCDIPARPGRVWVRITGHGVDPGHGHLVAFGDDAAVSGGLVGGEVGDPVFCGDAIADPLTGLEAALAAVDSLSRGGGELIEFSMAAVAATYAALPTSPSQSGYDALPPRRPPPGSAAPDLGADNEAVRRIVADRLATRC